MKNGKMSIRENTDGFTIYAEIAETVETLSIKKNLTPTSNDTKVLGCYIGEGWNSEKGKYFLMNVFPAEITNRWIEGISKYPEDFKNKHWKMPRKFYFDRIYYEGYYEEFGRTKMGNFFIVNYEDKDLEYMPSKKEALEMAIEAFKRIITKYKV